MLLTSWVPPREEYNQAVANILKRPEYAHLRRAFTDFIEGIKEALNRWIINLLNKLEFDSPSVPVISERLSYIFIILGLLIISAVIIFIIVKSTKTIEKNARVKEILGEKIDEKTTPFSLRAKAAAYGNEGDIRRAIRFDFIAVLLLMHERRLLYLDETFTNEEIYNYLKKEAFKNLKLFRNLTESFNSSWYGGKDCNAEDYSKWQSQMELLWNGVLNDER